MPVCERERKRQKLREKELVRVCFDKIILGIICSMDGEGQGGVVRSRGPGFADTTVQVCSGPAFWLGRTMGSEALKYLAVHLAESWPQPRISGQLQYPWGVSIYPGIQAHSQVAGQTEDMASRCKKHKHSALQTGPDGEILP